MRRIPPGGGGSISRALERGCLAVGADPPGGGCCVCVFLGAWRLAVRVPRQAV